MRHNTKLLNNLVPTIIALGFLLASQCTLAAPVLPPLNKPATNNHLTGKFIWFDLAAIDLDKEKEFYHSVFGWEFQSINDSEDQYTIIRNGPKNIAGMFSIKPPEGATQGALWIGLMSVDDPVKASKEVEKEGGSVHTPPTLSIRSGFA